MNDREMFEEWSTENIDDDVEFDKYDNSDNSPYFDGLVNATWKAWQASANREGYKLVPVNYECHWCGCTELDGFKDKP